MAGFDLDNDEPAEVADFDDGPIQLQVDGAFGSLFDNGEPPDMSKPHYSVEYYYHEKGIAQKLARSDRFINVTLCVIVANAVYLGIDQDWNKADDITQTHPFFVACDNLFCGYFTVELMVRFFAFKRKVDCVRDGWFRFDTFMVLLMVFETWVMMPMQLIMQSGKVSIPVEPFRLLRLLRLTRMARLMRSLPELVTMIKGMMMSSRAVGSSLLMVGCLVYIFAIILNLVLGQDDGLNDQLLGDVGLKFDSVTRCMWTLTIAGTLLLDGSGDVLTTLMYTPNFRCRVACMVFMLFILLASITVLNMLIGVLCEVVSQVARNEKDEAAIRLVKDSILMDLLKFDDGDGLITHEELMKVMNDRDSKKVLSSLNVDRLFLLELMQNNYTKPDSKMTIKEIMELMIQCRGDNFMTVSSFANGLSYITRENRKLRDSLVKEIQLTHKILDCVEHPGQVARSRSFAQPLQQPPSSAMPAASLFPMPQLPPPGPQGPFQW
jgi:voltage-gated sodium channel